MAMADRLLSLYNSHPIVLTLGFFVIPPGQRCSTAKYTSSGLFCARTPSRPGVVTSGAAAGNHLREDALQSYSSILLPTITMLAKALILVASVFSRAIPYARVELHTVKMVNQCGTRILTLSQNFTVLSTGTEETGTGPFESAMALDTDDCGFNREYCTIVEITLKNPTVLGQALMWTFQSYNQTCSIQPRRSHTLAGVMEKKNHVTMLTVSMHFIWRQTGKFWCNVKMTM
ncbi:uncharacterized protein BT62DRAFT_924809 [Guyanagaster necrorhizus]|uniref:Uncharacterized protein n=1 Tax=Guyanagaster necrorhizus TaxID=856835 RepID=A0A9P7VE81_9AGAR|nr:uncharacterized protein BT62DRAFT_924809 [Guyanagaster necrorhizus MCA 3950]KAG7439288.1 hypothetical protein BT62DRAFT_924809 [Guyanagaster necrorhizus MCA 3950]